MLEKDLAQGGELPRTVNTKKTWEEDTVSVKIPARNKKKGIENLRLKESKIMGRKRKKTNCECPSAKRAVPKGGCR